ncbi:MAG: Rpn family recombination-promoting nuclease/putative transposase [Planctomycetaceae bacterium]|nr:Rpn family recombination-promoting nuclease/putative transposase [Planctomycetaceae bacterium]
MVISLKKKNGQKTDKQPNNPHDRFAKKTLGNPLYAADFLKHYADPVIAQYVDLDQLVVAPTHYLTDELKEVILDAAFTAHLRDKKSGSEVLMFLEHKSKPSRFVPLQVGTHCFMSLYFGWTSTKYSERHQPAVPLMFLLYHGNKHIDEELFFQDIFPKIPEKLRPYVPQFRVFVINMKQFQYGNLPGKPETQAIVESFKRATDGTFGNRLCGILERVRDANLSKQQTLDLTANITQYCTWTNSLTSEEVVQFIKKVFNRTEGIKMATTIKKGIIQEGIEIGEARGKAIGKAIGELEARVNDILVILRKKFTRVPPSIVKSLTQRTDAVALTSLLILAATCSSLDEFIAEL